MWCRNVYASVFEKLSAFAVLKLKLDKTTKTMMLEQKEEKNENLTVSVFFFMALKSYRLSCNDDVFYFLWPKEKVLSFCFCSQIFIFILLMMCPRLKHLFRISISTLNF